MMFINHIEYEQTHKDPLAADFTASPSSPMMTNLLYGYLNRSRLATKSFFCKAL
jgi:hypothetical protein